MGVYIKDVVIPLNCCYCVFYDEKERACRLNWRQTPENKIQAFCPLIEVPTPHGRLIDENEIVGVKWYTPEGQLYTTDGVGYEVDAPTVIEAEDADLEAFDE